MEPPDVVDESNLPSVYMLERVTHLASQGERLEDVEWKCKFWNITEDAVFFNKFVSLVMFYVHVNKCVCRLKIDGKIY